MKNTCTSTFQISELKCYQVLVFVIYSISTICRWLSGLNCCFKDVSYMILLDGINVLTSCKVPLGVMCHPGFTAVYSSLIFISTLNQPQVIVICSYISYHERCCWFHVVSIFYINCNVQFYACSDCDLVNPPL